MEFPSRSPIQLLQRADGSLTHVGMPTVTSVSYLDPTIPAIPCTDQSIVGPINYSALWKQLGVDPAELDTLARPRGLSRRHFNGIVVDESELAIPGVPPRRPGGWEFASGGQLLTAEHSSYVIGLAEKLVRGHPSQAPEAKGEFILGDFVLYDSPLADRVWVALQDKVFVGFCGSTYRRAQDPLTVGVLAEIALTRRPMCTGARILKYWETPG